jgi:serine/threonine protein kinase
MQYLEGESLAGRLSRGPLRLDDALRYALEIASALDKAHSSGIIHRDLKPGNIMLVSSGPGKPADARLLDFGLARSTAAVKAPASTAAPTMTTPLTAKGSIVGTFQYMPPEQIEGQDADVRSDIWAFGCVLYEMLTGTRAFAGKSQASLIGSILKDEPPPIDAVQPLAPRSLDHVVHRCLAKDPDDRWQHIRDVRTELTWVAEGGGSEVPAARRRFPWYAAIGATALLTRRRQTGRPSPGGGAPLVASGNRGYDSGPPRVVNWDGENLPDEFRTLPPGRSRDRASGRKHRAHSL